MLHQIKSRFDASVLFELECGSLILCVEAAIKSDANLYGANLYGANLCDANLRGANYGNGIPMTKPPIQVFGLAWPVMILDAHMEIGCELHSLADWAGFNNDHIARMDGVTARRFWDLNKDPLLALARANGRSFINS